MRNDRFVLALKREHRDSVPGVLHGYSQTGATAYVEPQEIVVAGNEFQAAIEEARREETRILLELTRAILKERAAIELVVDCLAWADLAYAKRELMRRYEFAIPRIADDGVLSLSGRATRSSSGSGRERIFASRTSTASGARSSRSISSSAAMPGSSSSRAEHRREDRRLKTVGLIAVMAASACPFPHRRRPRCRSTGDLRRRRRRAEPRAEPEHVLLAHAAGRARRQGGGRRRSGHPR